MRVAFITRSTLYKVPGGDTIQIINTAKYLRKKGVTVDIFLTNEAIRYNQYDLLHFFNIIRPADILYHTRKTDIPFVISPILVDYSEYDRLHRKGISGFILQLFSENANEYLKTISRWILGKDVLKTIHYILKGHKNSIREILRKAAMVLPNSLMEYESLRLKYSVEKPYLVVPNGIDTELFTHNENSPKEEKLVICAARIEGIKNQLNLIKALNNSEFTLILTGDAGPNQKTYFKKCKEIAAGNITFTGRLPQEELVKIYKTAKVHVLPSWFETCGLSTLEAAALGCNVVITKKGYTEEYFKDDAFYCEPGDIVSILNAVKRAAEIPFQENLKERIFNDYTWEHAAMKTMEAYKKIIPL